MRKVKGFLLGLLSASSFGLIPLFSIPVISAGVAVNSVLSYRFLIAAVVVALLMLLSGRSFRVSRVELRFLFLLSVLYFFSALLLMEGYRYMPSGVATVIHFLYPVFVTLILFVFFHQRTKGVTFVAIAIAIAGVAFLTGLKSGGKVSLFGLVIVALSGLAYALYIVTVNKSCLRLMDNLKSTFYVMVFSGAVFVLYGWVIGSPIGWLPSVNAAWSVLLLALIPTVLSNVTLLASVKRIGSTTVAVLGALEPLTAVVVGVVVFDELFTVQMAVGVVLVLLAVTIIVGGDRLCFRKRLDC